MLPTLVRQHARTTYHQFHCIYLFMYLYWATYKHIAHITVHSQSVLYPNDVHAQCTYMYISIYTFTQFDSDTRTLFCNKHSMGQCATPCGRMAFWPVVVVIHYTTTRHTRGTHMPQKSSCVFIGGISCAYVRHKYVCVCRAGGWCHTTP